MFSKSIHVVTCLRTSFLSTARWYSAVCVRHTCLFIHQLVSISAFAFSWIMLLWTFLYNFLYNCVDPNFILKFPLPFWSALNMLSVSLQDSARLFIKDHSWILKAWQTYSLASIGVGCQYIKYFTELMKQLSLKWHFVTSVWRCQGAKFSFHSTELCVPGESPLY